MLKLCKYELRATGRTFLPLYGGLILISIFNHFIWGMDYGRLSGMPEFLADMTNVIASLVYAFLICAVLALTVFMMIQRFYKSLLGDEGYLMFTLPVPTWKLIASKAIVSALWIIGSGIAVMASAMIVSFTFGDVVELFGSVSWTGYLEFMADLSRVGAGEWLALLQSCLMGVIALLDVILLVYASIAIGHLWGKHRLLGAFLAFLALWNAAMVAMSLLGYFGMNLFNTAWTMDMTQAQVVTSTNLMLLYINASGLAFAAVCFFVTHRILSRKLNLE